MTCPVRGRNYKFARHTMWDRIAVALSKAFHAFFKKKTKIN